MLLNHSKKLSEYLYIYRLKKNKGLWLELTQYLVQSQSTGCSYTDYWKLYSFVRKNKPKEILECGTGVSTVVMAYALIENEQDGNGKGRVTSMESSSQYYDMQMSLIPQHIRPYVELILSDVIEDSFSLFRGVRYEKVPLDRKYDFVYVDDPSYEAPSDNTITPRFKQ